MNKIRPDSKDAVLEAAFQVFAENPKAGLGEVAARAGVGRATLNRHFAGRGDLMQALAKTALAELDEAVKAATSAAPSYEEGFRLSFHAIIPLADRQWFLAHEDFDPNSDIAVAYAASQDQLIADIKDAQNNGFLDPQMPAIWIAEVYENLIYAAWSLVRSGDATPKQAAELAWRSFCSGVTGDAT